MGVKISRRGTGAQRLRIALIPLGLTQHGYAALVHEVDLHLHFRISNTFASYFFDTFSFLSIYFCFYLSIFLSFYLSIHPSDYNPLHLPTNYLPIYMSYFCFSPSIYKEVVWGRENNSSVSELEFSARLYA